MRCLFIFEDSPISSNFSGAAARYWMVFNMLYKTGIEVFVWRVMSPSSANLVFSFEKANVDIQTRLATQAQGWDDTIIELTRPSGSKLQRFHMAIFEPIKFRFLHYINGLSEELLEHIERIKPDFLWVNYVNIAAVVSCLPLHIPWFYSHHDWLYKIQQLRMNQPQNLSLENILVKSSLKRAEHQIAKSASAIVTGSLSEAQELRKLGVASVYEIPTLYEEVPIISDALPDDVRLVHLGSLATTSNNLGLFAFLEKVFPLITKRSQVPLYIVGDADPENIRIRELRNSLINAGAFLSGYVPDLNTILRPFDIGIIPYENDTGFRTKLPLMFAHRQVVVATQAGAGSTPFLRNGENCIILPSLEDFLPEIIDLIQNSERRILIANEARKTFERHYTITAQLPQFRNMIDAIVRP